MLEMLRSFELPQVADITESNNEFAPYSPLIWRSHFAVNEPLHAKNVGSGSRGAFGVVR